MPLDELEASLGGHKLVTNSECLWDTAIVIHRRWMGCVRWFSTSPHAVWVGIRADEEFTFCSAHLPSWVSDECFEQAVEEVFETGKSRASGSIFVGIDANCNIDDNGDQRGILVRELCALQNLLPLFQRFWTLAWQSPTGATWKKKVDFCLTNQESAKVEIAENLHSRSDHKPLRLSRPHVRNDRDSWKEVKYRFICDAVRRWGGPRPLWKKAFVDSLAWSSMLVSSEL